MKLWVVGVTNHDLLNPKDRKKKTNNWIYREPYDKELEISYAISKVKP